MVPELVHFDLVLIRDGVHGGSNGALHCRWKVGTATYNPVVANSILYTCWLQVKQTLKLCDNETAPKRGQDGYEPAYKYNYLFFAIIENLNAVTERAELDLCGDETTYGHMGYGEAGSGLVSQIMNKPVSKGRQIVVLSDVSKNDPRAYLHCHKCHKKIDGFSKQGPAEV